MSKNQTEKFKQAARELECDDDPEAFKKRLGKLASAPPPDEKVPGSSKKPKTKRPAT